MAQTDLDGAAVLVLGATGGLGSRIARDLAGRGALLTLSGRDPDRLGALDVPGPRFTADLARAVDCAAIVDAAVREHGRLDGVVNAAGVVAFGPLADTPVEVVEQVIAVDLLGPLRVMAAALLHLAASDRGGFVVNLSGLVAEVPTAGMVAYSAAKAGLAAGGAALAREVRRAGVTVIDVRPPHTATGLTGRTLAGDPPRLPDGLDPDAVAARVVEAIVAREREVPGAAFSRRD
jgi:cyclic-di-GMP-binding biofilm dispersal mediator protein